jgi:deoxyribonuclease-4
MSNPIGAHVDQTDPIAEAQARQAPLVQFFLGDPQGYKGPEVRFAGGAAALRAAAEIGAKGLIVHGGHVNKTDDPAKGFDNWRKAIEATDIKIPLLIENTAGGDNAMARHLDRIAGVWDAISHADGFEKVGFCLDTCHAGAGGIELPTAVEKVRSITGRIDLVHANDSRDAFDSGADRHANFGNGQLDEHDFAGVVREAGAPVICETPGGAAEHQADFAWLREHGV